ncbi:hypothetical protein [Anaeromusa acidaminophila]|uniref:hypothetical protein n=1 Tax=Anaeromusa acidaminophila TaxID=81464 RepID=UPI000382A0BB|nr:hypothetical protein [Anaeromusa acidaminophila]
MKVRIKTHKEGGHYCYCCGKEIKKEYLINLGSAGSEFEICRSCLKKLNRQITRVLEA